MIIIVLKLHVFKHRTRLYGMSKIFKMYDPYCNNDSRRNSLRTHKRFIALFSSSLCDLILVVVFITIVMTLASRITHVNDDIRNVQKITSASMILYEKTTPECCTKCTYKDINNNEDQQLKHGLSSMEILVNAHIGQSAILDSCICYYINKGTYYLSQVGQEKVDKGNVEVNQSLFNSKVQKRRTGNHLDSIGQWTTFKKKKDHDITIKQVSWDTGYGNWPHKKMLTP